MPLVKTRVEENPKPNIEFWQQLRPHYVQSHLWNCPTRFAAVAAGRGSGKTLLAKRKIVKALTKRNGMFFYALPTYKQAKRVVWRDLKSMVPPSWLSKKPNETELYIETIFGSQLYLVGMDSPERIEGSQYDFGILDEACDQRPNVFQATIRPALTDKKGGLWQIGAIKFGGIGSGAFHDFCMNASRVVTTAGIETHPEKDPDVSYFNWPSETILLPEEIESAKRQLDDETYNSQMAASWQNAKGSIFYAFQENVHVRTNVVYCPQLPIVVGSDFNVNPMVWVLGHFHNGILTIFDEIYIRNTNTDATLNELYRRYGTHTSGWRFFGDASGRQRRTSAATTDYLLIKNDVRFQDAMIHYPNKNPNRVDRFACTNAGFKTASKEVRCYISPHCKMLIKDLKQRAYKEGTREPNDVGDIGHPTDAFGYICYKVFPPALNSILSSQAQINTRE
jgi:hypothetical protein